MAEYSREQKSQLSRAVANNGAGSRQLKGFGDRNVIANGLNQMERHISALNIATIQRANEKYLYGAANKTPHISQYPGGCHLKIAGGDRYDLVKDGFRVKQGLIDDAFNAVRTDYPLPDNPIRIALLDIMRRVLRDTDIRPEKKE